ncbi:MAG: hypothetical protein ACKVRP_09670 [Bacteroidota bacterium]
MRHLFTILIVFSAVMFLSCSEEIADNPLGNQTPKTFLWLFPDSTVGVGVSRQRLQWWGEDPDGVVVGYLFSYGVFPNTVTSIPSPDTLRYSWVTKNDTLMLFPLDTLFRNYTVFVRAVDNGFTSIPAQSIVRFTPSPYWDKNDNGVFDGTDELLPALSGAVDPVGVVQTFPVRNTPPTITFARNPNDETLEMRQPDTTYTVATFAWNGQDNDGQNTLASFRIALNDTSNAANWLTIPIRDTVVTLVVPRSRSDAAGAEVAADVYGGRFLGRQLLGTVSGLRLDAPNVLYVQVRDVAGEYSEAITQPSGSGVWFVKKPRGGVLLVSDYINSDAVTARNTYVSAIAAAGVNFQAVDQLDIGLGLTAADKRAGKYGLLVPPFVDPAMIQTFLLYDYVVWYTDQYPTLGAAQLSLFAYLQNGGKVIFSTTFENSVDPRGALRDFAPIDSISSVDLSTGRPPTPPPVAGDTRIPANFSVLADSSIPGSEYPQLAFNSAPPNHLIFMRPIYRRSDARYLYHLQADTRNRYLGMPNVAVVDGEQSIIFVGLPLHLLNNTDPAFGNPNGLAAFFIRALNQEFRSDRAIDRRRF